MITSADMKRLAAIPGPCLTICEPLRDAAGQALRTDVELADAIRKADMLLARQGLDEPARESFLNPVRNIATNTEWSAHAGGMVIFRAPDFTKAAFWPDVLQPPYASETNFSSCRFSPAWAYKEPSGFWG